MKEIFTIIIIYQKKILLESEDGDFTSCQTKNHGDNDSVWCCSKDNSRKFSNYYLMMDDDLFYLKTMEMVKIFLNIVEQKLKMFQLQVSFFR